MDNSWINVPGRDRERLLKDTLFTDCAFDADGFYGETEGSIHRFPVDWAAGERINVMRENGRLRIVLTVLLCR